MAPRAREDDSERRICFSKEVIAKKKYYSTRESVVLHSEELGEDNRGGM